MPPLDDPDLLPLAPGPTPGADPPGRDDASAEAPPARTVSRRRWWRLGMKALHDVASIGYGGALAACLVIEAYALRAAPAELATARQLFASIAQFLLVPSMAVVVVSGLVAMMATRAYLDAGWAWVKALLGLVVFQATLLIAGASRERAELVRSADAAAIEALLRSERNTLWLLVVLCVANVVLAVWRPRLTYRVR